MSLVEELSDKRADDSHAATEFYSISRFLFNEAQLADKGKYDEWLTLWVDKGCQYWVPCNVDDADPTESLAIILDDRRHLEERIVRMKHRNAHTFSQPARAQRVIGNINVIKEGEEWVVTSSFSLGSISRGGQSTWFGESEHRLIGGDGSWLIKSKKVNLLNNDETLTSLLFLP